MIKEFLNKRNAKIQAKRKLMMQTMYSEIVNAIQTEVIEQQKTTNVNLPYFCEVNHKIDALHIKTAQDLTRTYKEFAKQGRVSGVIHV